MIKTMIVRSQVKDFVKSLDYNIENVSSDFFEMLDKKVEQIIKESCRRAKENGRKTVMPRDL